MMRTARKELGLASSETIMIGDTMETDILGGVQMGYRTILVLSGGTRADDLIHYAYRPDMIIDSLADIADPQRLTELFPTLKREDDTPLNLDEWMKVHS
jgi:NagD protein